MTADNITELWKNAGFELYKGRTLHICKISSGNHEFLGEIESSEGVENTGYAMRIRFLYHHDSEYWDNHPDKESENIIQAAKNSNLRFNISNLNLSKIHKPKGRMLYEPKEEKLFEVLNITPETLSDDLEAMLVKSNATGDVAFVVQLKNSRLRPQKLGELLGQRFGWKVEPLFSGI